MPIPLNKNNILQNNVSPVFFLDLDGTLKTEFDKNIGSMTITEPIRHVFEPRPFAKEFLTAISSLGKIYLCTASPRAFATSCLKQMGIDDYFDGVFARESYANGIPFFSKIIFIENNRDLGEKKINCIKNNENADILLIVIETYNGNKEDKELISVLNSIKDILS